MSVDCSVTFCKECGFVT